MSYWTFLHDAEALAKAILAKEGGDKMAKRKIEEEDVRQLVENLTVQYQNEELARAVAEDAVKLGTVKDLLEGSKNTPTLAEAKRWLENQKKQAEKERQE